MCEIEIYIHTHTHKSAKNPYEDINIARMDTIKRTIEVSGHRLLHELQRMAPPSEQELIIIIPPKSNSVGIYYLNDCFKDVPALLTRALPETPKVTSNWALSSPSKQ